MPSPATFPSVLSCSGPYLADANGYIMPILKGMDVQINPGNNFANTAGDYTAMAAEGVQVIRMVINWDQLWPSATAPTGSSDISGIDATYVAAIDFAVAQCVANQIYTYFNFYFGPVGLHAPSWMSSAPAPNPALPSCMSNYLFYGQSVTQYLAKRYGDSANPLGVADASYASPGQGVYTPAVIGWGLNEVTPDTPGQTNNTWLAGGPSGGGSTGTGGLYGQQGTMVSWFRTYAPNWIGVISSGFGAGPAYANAPGTSHFLANDQTFNTPAASMFAGGGALANCAVNLHDYFLAVSSGVANDDGRDQHGKSTDGPPLPGTEKTHNSSFLTYPPPSVITTVAAGSNGQLVTASSFTLSVASTSGFPSSGTITVQCQTGVATLSYAATSGGNQFTGCNYVSGGTGTTSTGYSVGGLPLSRATCQSQAAAFLAPQVAFCSPSWANVPFFVDEFGFRASQATPPTAWTGGPEWIADHLAAWQNAGAAVVAQWQYGTKQVGAGGDGLATHPGGTNTTSSYTAATSITTLAVTSTGQYPNSGTISVAATGGPAVLSYTNTTSTQFQGCTWLSGGTGAVANGALVTSFGVDQNGWVTVSNLFFGPAPFPSVLRCRGPALVDSTGSTLPVMKGFCVQNYQVTGPYAASVFTGMYNKGVRIIRMMVMWDHIEPTAGNIDNTWVTTHLDVQIANAVAAGIYVWLGFYFGPNGNSMPVWAQTTGGPASCMGNYVANGQHVTQYLAQRYGDPADPLGAGQYTPAVIGMGINEPTPDKAANSSNLDYLVQCVSEQAQMADWMRVYAPTWILSLSSGFGSSAWVPDAAGSGHTAGSNHQTFTAVPAVPVSSLGGNPLANFWVDLHDYNWCTNDVASPDYDGRTQFGANKSVSSGGIQIQRQDSAVYPPSVAGITLTQDQLTRMQTAYHATIAAYAAPGYANCPIIVGEYGWDPVLNAAGGIAINAINKLATWQALGPVAITQWDYAISQTSDPLAAFPGTGKPGADVFGWQVWTDIFLSTDLDSGSAVESSGAIATRARDSDIGQGTDGGEFISTGAHTDSDTASATDASAPLRQAGADTGTAVDASSPLPRSSSDTGHATELGVFNSTLVVDGDICASTEGSPVQVGIADLDFCNAAPIFLVASADTFAASDVGALSWASADTGAAAEASTVTAQLPDSDVLLGSESGLGFGLSDTDLVSGTEAAQPPASPVSDADAFSGTEAGVAAPGALSADTASLTDTEAVFTQPADSDTGTAAEDAQYIALSQDADAAAGAEDSTVGVTDADAAAGAEALVLHVLGTDTGHHTENGFVPTGPQDEESAVFTEASLIHATLPSADSGSGREGYSYDIPLLTQWQTAPFTIIMAAILNQGDGSLAGTLYGVRNGRVDLSHAQYPLFSNDQQTGAWNNITDVTVTVEGGFLPYAAVPVLLGYPAAGSPGQAFSVSLFLERILAAPPTPVLLRALAQDHFGRARTLDIILYAVRFISFTASPMAYKDGLSVTWTGRAVLSSVSEFGGPLGSPAIGRLLTQPGAILSGGVSGWQPVIQLSPGSEDFGTLGETSAIRATLSFPADTGHGTDAGGPGTSFALSSADTGAGAESNGSIITGVQFRSDTDTGAGTESLGTTGTQVAFASADTGSGAEASNAPGASGVQFQLTGMCGGGTINVHDSSAAGVWAAGGDTEGYFISYDQGAHWACRDDGTVAAGRQAHSCACIQWSLTEAGSGYAQALYSCCGDQGNAGGFMVSLDEARSWSLRSAAVQFAGNAAPLGGLIPGGDPRSTRRLLAQDGSHGELYCATYTNGIWRSPAGSNGAAWTQMGFSAAQFWPRCVCLSDTDHTTLYASFYGQGVYKAQGNARTVTGTGTTGWTVLPSSPRVVEEMVILEGIIYAACAGSGQAYKGTDVGFYRSADGGGTWQQLNGTTLNTATSYWNSVDAYKDPGTGKHIVILACGFPSPQGAHNVYKAECNANGTGTPVFTDLTAGAINNTALPPDGRTTWASGQHNLLTDANSKNVFVRVDRSDPSFNTLVYSGQGGIWRTLSAQQGTAAAWDYCINGMSLFWARGMELDPSDTSKGFVCDSDWCSFQFLDMQAAQPGHTALTLQRATSPSFPEGLCIAYDGGATPSQAYMGGSNKYSATGGDVVTMQSGFAGNWVSGGLKSFTTAAVFGVWAGRDASNHPYVLAATAGAGLWRWSGTTATAVPAAGSTWTQRTTACAAAASIPSGPTLRVIGDGAALVFAFDKNAGIWRSTDYGVSWAKIWAVTAGPDYLGEMYLNPQVANELWVSCDPVTPGDSGLYRVPSANTVGTVVPGTNATAVNNLPTAGTSSGKAGPLFIRATGATGRVYVVMPAAGSGNSTVLVVSTNSGTSWTVASDTSLGDVASHPRFVRMAGTRMFIALDLNTLAWGVPSA